MHPFSSASPAPGQGWADNGKQLNPSVDEPMQELSRCGVGTAAGVVGGIVTHDAQRFSSCSAQAVPSQGYDASFLLYGPA